MVISFAHFDNKQKADAVRFSSGARPHAGQGWKLQQDEAPVALDRLFSSEILPFLHLSSNNLFPVIFIH